MTTFSFKDAAILAHLSRNPRLDKEAKNSIASGLSKEAASSLAGRSILKSKVAKELKRHKKTA
jgi:hypothetical protein